MNIEQVKEVYYQKQARMYGLGGRVTGIALKSMTPILKSTICMQMDPL